MSGVKLSNQYQNEIYNIAYDCPKSVLAAIVVSLMSSGGDHMGGMEGMVALEWERLHQAGIVPQALPARYRDAAQTAREAEGM